MKKGKVVQDKLAQEEVRNQRKVLLDPIRVEEVVAEDLIQILEWRLKALTM